MSESAHISLHEVKLQLGLGDTGLERFLAATKLQVFNMPGGGRVLYRAQFNQVVADLIREQIG